jgi:hypothetical protein
MFIGVHMPSYLKDFGMAPHVASYSLALVGLFNIFGTYLAGNLGQKLPKRYLLSGIYGLRSVATVAFLLAPLSPWSVYAFCAAMGFLWLSTVPLTNATIAQIFGVQHLSMLGGFVFFSHQIGSFLGVWLGGYLYDINGNYDMVWYISIALGIFAAVVNLPVREAAIVRSAPAAPPDTGDTAMRSNSGNASPSGVPCSCCCWRCLPCICNRNSCSHWQTRSGPASELLGKRPGGMAGREHGPHHHHRSLGRHRRRNGPPAGTNPSEPAAADAGRAQCRQSASRGRAMPGPGAQVLEAHRCERRGPVPRADRRRVQQQAGWTP